jgi:hypothetical protein
MLFQVAAQFFMVSAPAVVTIIGEARKPTAAKASKAVLIFMGDIFMGDPFLQAGRLCRPTKGADRRNLAVSQPDTTVSYTSSRLPSSWSLSSLSGDDL